MPPPRGYARFKPALGTKLRTAWLGLDDRRRRSISLAPYSFFNAMVEAPPTLAFSSHGAKHSATFAGEAREPVWHPVTCELVTDFPYSLTLEGR